MNEAIRPDVGAAPLLDNLTELCRQAQQAAEALGEAVRSNVAARVMQDGRVDSAAAEREQFAGHGYAWVATYVTALRELLNWAERLEAAGRLGELERLILQAGFGEYLFQLTTGIAMSQGEILRPADMGLDPEDLERLTNDAVRTLTHGGNTAAVRQRIAALVEDGNFGDPGLEDEVHLMMRDQFRRFADERVAPYANDWHRADILIPDDVVAALAELGVFGLTLPEAWGGSGLGKVSVCVVTEELSRGWLGVGSLATRSEIAGELVLQNGTAAQKDRWLKPLATGEVWPTAVFTEPNTGSDLASISTRAVRAKNDKGEDVYRIHGAKTWITHGARTDMMTLLARTGPAGSGFKGISMFLAPKPRGTDDNPFPADGMTGGEIGVLGYRGMKEYDIAFDGFEVPADCLLGEAEGQGFKQLMTTFESARIQTAARSLGVAQNALELALAYATDRNQFGKPIYAFPRVSGKIAWMAVETMIARQLSYFAAREKDTGRRCDIEAGMAKLLAARIAWANADMGVQVHGGNGYSEEFRISRVLADARILNIFEGAAEIQAQIITRGLLGAAELTFFCFFLHFRKISEKIGKLQNGRFPQNLRPGPAHYSQGYPGILRPDSRAGGAPAAHARWHRHDHSPARRHRSHRSPQPLSWTAVDNRGDGCGEGACRRGTRAGPHPRQ